MGNPKTSDEILQEILILVKQLASLNPHPEEKFRMHQVCRQIQIKIKEEIAKIK